MPTLTFKVTEEEARRIRALARQRQVSLSEYLRRQAQAGTPRPGPVRRVRCPHTGALIFAGVPGCAPLDTETVRELLSDFP